MFDQLLDKIENDNPEWAQLKGLLFERQILSKTVLLSEGEISTHAFLIKKGCLREWFNKDGKFSGANLSEV